MMIDPTRPDAAPDPADTGLDIFDLPLQPTGSGVADLEIAYEQMKLAEAADAPDLSPTSDDPVAPDPLPRP